MAPRKHQKSSLKKAFQPESDHELKLSLNLLFHKIWPFLVKNCL